MELWQLTASELLDHLDAGEVSAVEVVTACIARVEATDEQVNALPVRRFEEALAEAEAADAARARGEAGPLCGLPTTVKENLDLEGTDCTMGLAHRQGQPSERDAVFVGCLRAAGAVVLGKTNVPQLMLAQETENALFGVTKNPWNLERVPGGSSGGEAAAIATGMVPCGVGTDIGGSIRIPCHFTGITGLKPTLDRWSNRGSNGAILGQEVVRSQIGPMARSVDDLRRLLDALDPVEMAALDPNVPPLPLGEAPDLQGLRVGFYEDDGYLTPTRGIRRAVRRACAVLEDAGACLVHLPPPDQGEALYLWLAAISSDGGATLDQRLAGEAISPQLRLSRRMLAVPATARKAGAALLERMGDRRTARLLREAGRKPVETLWALTERRTELKRAEFDAWNAAEVDAMVCPPHSAPALGHRESGDFALSLSYPFRYSLLNFPAGVVPVTRVTPEDVEPAPKTRDRVERKLAEIDQQSPGLPVGVQVVARPYREEVALAVMAAVEAGVRDDAGYPTTPVEP